MYLLGGRVCHCGLVDVDGLLGTTVDGDAVTDAVGCGSLMAGSAAGFRNLLFLTYLVPEVV